MKIFTNKYIKNLFLALSVCFAAYVLFAVIFMVLGFGSAAVFILSIVFSAAALFICLRYFTRQNKIIEDAALKITQYLSGDKDARIDCLSEGELYKLFHEINTLTAVLNAHAENEGRSKEFLKNTISDISHQLKTPIAALSIYNGLIQSEAENLPEIKNLADLSERELDRIETLVQNLLKITKLDAGAIVLNKTEENVAEMILDIRTRFLYRAEQENKELTASGSDDIEMLCDRAWLTEAIGNIVKNAFDHTAAGGQIQIEYKRFASVIQIIIKDNGSGIHPEDLHHIFKRFYRSRFSKDTQGIGLGLPLAKTIIEAHGGNIEVSSEPGMGTEFIINFLIPTKLYG